MALRRGSGIDGSFSIMGTRIPVVVGALIGLTLGLSILGAVGRQTGFPLTQSGALFPLRVWEGEVWRLFTWIFFETEPFPLIFACLGLWWFGSDLAYAWGARRFLAVYFGFALVSAGVTCLLARSVWPGLTLLGYAGNWPLVDALVIAWAVLYPHRQIFVYFVLPLGGRNLIYLTIAGTLLLGVFNGFGQYLPHLTAEALMLLYMRELSLRYLWLRLKFAMTSRRRSQLRPVDRDTRNEPPRWLH